MKVLNEIEEVGYEQVVAGLLLKLKSIDSIDFSLLIKEFEDKTSTKVRDLRYCEDGKWFRADKIGEYLKCEEDGDISLKEGVSLNDFIEEEGRSLREKFVDVAGSQVIRFIDGIDIEQYKDFKEKSVKGNKRRVLSQARVLLISDIQDDYDELISYGFKNIDYFKSIIRADTFFSKHPEELKKYHIILKGNQNVQHCCYDGDVELDRTIDALREQRHIIVPSLQRHSHSMDAKFVAYLRDYKNHRSWRIEEQTFKSVLDKIVDNMLINHTLDEIGIENGAFTPIKDEINPNRLPLPVKMSDLKILYLGSPGSSEYFSKIVNLLGLDITFMQDSNVCLGKNVKTHLGEYDIIIVTKNYSYNLLSMNNESTEQCKDTGRELTLFVSQEYRSWEMLLDRDIANKIDFEYTFGGNLAPDFDYHFKTARILKHPIKTPVEYQFDNEALEEDFYQIRGIIGAAIGFYNQSLINAGKSPISDLTLQSADELDSEYKEIIINEQKKREAELAPIELFDNIRNIVLKYLRWRNAGLISTSPEGLIITEENDGVKVENVFQGRTLCAIVFPKESPQDELRIFEIQAISKKGSLTGLQRVGVYTSKYDNLESTPKRPDENQTRGLTSLEKKIKAVLVPLIEETQKRQLEASTQRPKKLELKRCDNTNKTVEPKRLGSNKGHLNASVNAGQLSSAD